jgi:hypothetical protein
MFRAPRTSVIGLVLAALLASAAGVEVAMATDWDPGAFKDESTLEFMSLRDSGREHWSPVWLVVVGGDLYLRLGNRAVGNLKRSTIYPDTRIRVAGKEFKARLAEANDMAERVAEAMADKYGFDLLVRYWPHPLTARIQPRD